jgi:hypothetical protein
MLALGAVMVAVRQLSRSKGPGTLPNERQDVTTPSQTKQDIFEMHCTQKERSERLITQLSVKTQDDACNALKMSGPRLFL